MGQSIRPEARAPRKELSSAAAAALSASELQETSIAAAICCSDCLTSSSRGGAFQTIEQLDSIIPRRAKFMRCNLCFARLNPAEQSLEHLAESTLGSLREGVYRLKLIHCEPAKLDMADIDFVPQRHCRNEIAFDPSFRKAKCSQPGPCGVARGASASIRQAVASPARFQTVN
jgi:hypothetical protein